MTPQGAFRSRNIITDQRAHGNTDFAVFVRITLTIGKSFGVFGVYGGFPFFTFYILLAISIRDTPLNLVVSIAHYAEDDTWTIRLLSLDRQAGGAHALVLHELRANFDASIE